MNINEVYIVATARTPIGSFGGCLAQYSAVDLGAMAISKCVEKAGISDNEIDELLFGNVLSANLGQAPARQAALKAGLPESINCTTINKVCASGAKAIMLGSQAIMLGHAQAVIAGGMESMSNVPFYIPKARFGYKYGSASLVDGLEYDGLKDAYDNCAMGMFADKTAEKYQISRKQQDEFAVRSYQNAKIATEAGHFSEEIAIIEIPQKDGSKKIIDQDEEFKNVNFEKIPNLKPVFSKEGTVTAANASTINDGASAVLLISKEKATELNLRPLAKIVSFSDAEQSPEWFTTSPLAAFEKALKLANLTITEIDFFEINEAFSVVPLVFQKVLNVPLQKINIWGGAVSIGHPLGNSGSRILVTLTSILINKKSKYGAIAICNGGGGASSIIIENMTL
jgi:acetyl-CoA C-acetyltransferase